MSMANPLISWKARYHVVILQFRMEVFPSIITYFWYSLGKGHNIMGMNVDSNMALSAC